MRKLIGLVLVSLLLLTTGVTMAQQRTYTVQRGDTLRGIANAFNVELEALLIQNNIIDPNRIRVGQQLIIPTGAVMFPRRHVVQPGETLRDIAIRYNTTVQALQQANQIANPNNLIVGRVLILPAVGGPANYPRTYQLEIGDTLRSVAAEFGTTVEAIAAYNNIANPNYVQAGMTIIIPPASYTPPPSYHVPHQPPSYTPPATITYVVQPGDTLSQIAVRFGSTVEGIRRANNIRNNRAIFAGDVLIIPIGNIVPPTSPPRPVVGGVYTVRPGDTLFRIAAAFNVNIYDLAEVNGILNLNSIFAGQRLRIPGYH